MSRRQSKTKKPAKPSKQALKYKKAAEEAFNKANIAEFQGKFDVAVAAYLIARNNYQYGIEAGLDCSARLATVNSALQRLGQDIPPGPASNQDKKENTGSRRRSRTSSNTGKKESKTGSPTIVPRSTSDVFARKSKSKSKAQSTPYIRMKSQSEKKKLRTSGRRNKTTSSLVTSIGRTIHAPTGVAAIKKAGISSDVKSLLKWCVEGHIPNVNKLLKENPKLVYERGPITDPAGRPFTDFTAFQCVMWSLDTVIAKVILQYLPPSHALEQLKELESKDSLINKQHGAHYDFPSLMEKMKHHYDWYIKNHEEWDGYNNSDSKAWEKYWQDEVGVAQRQIPAWLVYFWCEQGDNAAWPKREAARKPACIRQYNLKYQYDQEKDKQTHLEWWWDKSVKSKRSAGGSVLGVVRGNVGIARKCTSCTSIELHKGIYLAKHDVEMVQKLITKKSILLRNLRSYLEKEAKKELANAGQHNEVRPTKSK